MDRRTHFECWKRIVSVVVGELEGFMPMMRMTYVCLSMVRENIKA